MVTYRFFSFELYHLTFVFLTVNESYFNRLYPRNPVNLFVEDSRCDSPQPRYMKHPDFIEIDSKFKYLLYHQCLPGCVVYDDNVTVKETYKYTDKGIRGDRVNVTITNDETCMTYDSTSKNPTKGKQTEDSGPQGRNSHYPGNIFFA